MVRRFTELFIVGVPPMCVMVQTDDIVRMTTHQSGEVYSVAVKGSAPDMMTMNYLIQPGYFIQWSIHDEQTLISLTNFRMPE